MGEIFWVDFGPPDSHEQALRRPCVVMSRNDVNANGETVIVVPLTTKLHKANSYRIQVPAGMIVAEPGQRLETSVALCDHVREIDKRKLESRAGRLSQTAIRGIALGLAYVFDIR
ncbi:MAG: type II toxin-antitoxin system PemK/MazF family toxin [Terriglobales bacterium]